MLAFSELKKTRVYQEAVLEGKLEGVPFMLSLGATLEQIAEALDLEIEQVRQAAESTQQKDVDAERLAGG